MHPLLHLIASRPQWLAEHAQAYVELASEEAVGLVGAWHRRVVLATVALVSAGAAAVLVGVALMLWAVVPGVQMQAVWALWVVPLPALALAGYCQWAQGRAEPGAAFAVTRRQLQADLAMLRDMEAP